ncbi:Branched-chain amino acid transport protein (AzlD) [Glycomyces sambucus]|uniref:Branched-chain amino acid transport protein (AzlD) n=1 Tax=Glycomyces sambucus TaxID=380244 RepID=A0A1G9DR79_9ACTN|nr:AzlD domain-containing protein [Glycomyces sambucus]SDK66325.1 Branched-chain amino acid transport protein (AzlD) [Glycomyces sambucus]
MTMFIAIMVLAAGTFLIRLSGPLLRERISLSPYAETLLKTGATVVLLALVATSAFVVDGAWAGWALPAGVLVGGVLAWRRAPLALVVVAAAATTALLRLAGVA